MKSQRVEVGESEHRYTRLRTQDWKQVTCAHNDNTDNPCRQLFVLNCPKQTGEEKKCAKFLLNYSQLVSSKNAKSGLV